MALLFGPPKPLGWRKIYPTPRARSTTLLGPPKPPGWRKIRDPSAVTWVAGRGVPRDRDLSFPAPCWCEKGIVLVPAAKVGSTTWSCGRRGCDGPDRITGGVEYWEPIVPFCGWQMPPEPLAS